MAARTYIDAAAAVIFKALDRAGLDLETLKITIEGEDISKITETVAKPFAGFSDFEACVVAQTGKGHSAESARKICGALQAETEGKAAGDTEGEPQGADSEIEVPGKITTKGVLAKGFRIQKTAEERFVLGIVLEPTKEMNQPDTQNDVYSAEEIAKASDIFMSDYQQIGIQHKTMTDKVKILRNWITLEDSTIGGQPVAKGTWLLGVRVLDDALWEKVKAGEVTAFSIGGKAQREEIE